MYTLCVCDLSYIALKWNNYSYYNDYLRYIYFKYREA